VSGRERRRLDRPALRLLALLVAVAAGLAIWRLPTPGAPRLAVATVREAPASAGDCERRRRAEVEALKASGGLDAEQAMRMRQLIARECAAGP
jgi:hypothetical protein